MTNGQKHIRAAIMANNRKGAVTVILEPQSSLDEAVIGHKTYKRDGLTRIIYGFNKLVRAFMTGDGMDEEEAVDWVCYNTIRAIPYMGGKNRAEPVVHMK